MNTLELGIIFIIVGIFALIIVIKYPAKTITYVNIRGYAMGFLGIALGMYLIIDYVIKHFSK